MRPYEPPSSDVLEQVRQHYMAQFDAFITEQEARWERGAPEVKLQLGDHSRVFRRLYCADFVRNDTVREILELSPEYVLSFEPVVVSVGSTDVAIEAMSWDDAVLSHDLESVPAAALDPWFDHWFDPDDRRHVPGARFSKVIHSLIVEGQRISVDLGSAPAEALADLLGVLSAAGASRIVIQRGREG